MDTPFKHQSYRLVTRSDFDGLVCAMILEEIGILDDILFVHPKDIQDGKIDLYETDILTNLPFNENAGIVFDHHESEKIRNMERLGQATYILDPDAASAARVVYEYFKPNYSLERITPELMEAVDKADSAQYSIEDILQPEGWALLNFIMDARTGLGRFRNFRISNYNLMMELIHFCLDHSIDEVLAMPDVKERVDLYFDQQEKFKQQLEEVTQIKGKVAIIDLRKQDPIYAGNRFYVYALYPHIEISIHLTKGFRNQNTPIMIGKSIINRSSNYNIGETCLKYGGGGHKNAGTCQVDNDKADDIVSDIVDDINQHS